MFDEAFGRAVGAAVFLHLRRAVAQRLVAARLLVHVAQVELLGLPWHATESGKRTACEDCSAFFDMVGSRAFQVKHSATNAPYALKHPPAKTNMVDRQRKEPESHPPRVCRT